MLNLTEHQQHLVQSSFQVLVDDVDVTAQTFYSSPARESPDF